MSDPISLSGVAGSQDGKAPIYEPDGRWTTWSINQLYRGTVGDNHYVPNVEDYVIDPLTNEKWRVVAVDPTTLIPTLVSVKDVDTGEFSDIDILLGVGPGTQSDTYRVYIDKSVMPYTLAVDARLKVNGSMVTSCKIFKGPPNGSDAQVISAMYDQGGTLLGQSIPLELVAMPNGQNYAVKSVPVCYTTENLVDEEVVTAVFYSDTGGVVSKRQLLVENTAFIRSSDSAVKYVTEIRLETPFLSEADPTLIQYPINVPLNGMNLMGVVEYSDGTIRRMPVDGTKFVIFGFEHFVATIVGQKMPVILKYNLSSDEIAYGLTVAADRFMTKNYKAITKKAEGAYTTKLFGFPMWVDPINGYRVEWYLYNLERQLVYRATPHVRFNENTRAFDPLAYGVSQRVSVSVNLRDVNPVYKNYIHVQTMDIVLAQRGDEQTGLTRWTVGFEPGQNPPFGRENFADVVMVNQNFWRLRLASGAVTQDEWFTKLYFNTKPLLDPSRESLPPTPTHFKVVRGVNEIEFPISQWDQDLVLSQPFTNFETVFVKFFKRTVENDIQLAVAGLPVRFVSGGV
ncbi:hypothetical protein D3C71_78640 [compost metagenome]